MYKKSTFFKKLTLRLLHLFNGYGRLLKWYRLKSENSCSYKFNLVRDYQHGLLSADKKLNSFEHIRWFNEFLKNKNIFRFNLLKIAQDIKSYFISQINIENYLLESKGKFSSVSFQVLSHNGDQVVIFSNLKLLSSLLCFSF